MRTRRCSLYLCVILVFMPTSRIWAKGDVALSGDVLRVLIPAGTFTYAMGSGDDEGKIQLLKSFLSSSTTTYALKSIVDKDRPNGGSKSFPSGHATMVFSSAAFVHDRYGVRPALPIYILATYVGWSRIQSGHHDFWDVAAGAVIGMVPSYYFSTPFKKQAYIQPVIEKEKMGFVFNMTW